jgi:AraC-like DNA-binding protein
MLARSLRWYVTNRKSRDHNKGEDIDMMASDNQPKRLLIGRERLFYTGLLGNSRKPRRLGSFTIHVATSGSFDIKVGDGTWQSRRIFALKPFTPHQLWSAADCITTVSFESETVNLAYMEDLFTQINESDEGGRLANHIETARQKIMLSSAADGFSTREFDDYVLSRIVPRRRTDYRIENVLDRLLNDLREDELSAAACAAKVRLSTSRFLHLFKDETKIPFRSLRMWKRARRFLDHANADDRLTNVALDLGYPDSSHFSHSIRALFGLQPRSIRDGSQGMTVCFGENYVSSRVS